MEDLQNLLEKINREGVAKAEAAAEKIHNEAVASAKACMDRARANAARLREEAERAAQESVARSTETLRQAARDTILKIESSVTALLERLLTQNVEKALADEQTAVALAADAVRDLVGRGEITAAPRLAAALKAQLAAQGSLTVVTDETFGTGFSVKVDNGRVENTFTGEVIAAELAKRLRPELAQLLK